MTASLAALFVDLLLTALNLRKSLRAALLADGALEKLIRELEHKVSK